MDILVRAVLGLRRGVRRCLVLFAAALAHALVALDAAHPLPSAALAAAAAVVGLLILARVVDRRHGGEPSARVDVELGALLGAAGFATVLRLDGSLSGPSYPLLLVLVGLLATFARPLPAVVLLLWFIGFELFLRTSVLPGDLSLREPLLHAGFMIVFAVLNAVVLRGEVARIRNVARARLKAEMERLRDEARSYRLLAAPSTQRGGFRPDDEERLARSGVEEIHQAALLALSLLRESLGLHTALLLWLNDSGTHLRIAELSSLSSSVAEGPFLAGDGVFGAAVAKRAIVSLTRLKPGHKLPYYTGECPVRTVAAVPVLEHGAVRGLLVLDRVEDRPFSVREEELAVEATRYAVRAVQNERVFVQLERAKVEQGKLYRAAEALGAALSEQDVVEAGVKSAREIASIDFAAVTLYDDAARAHRICAVSGEGAAELSGQTFRHNAGLVAMVLANRHPLPYKGEYDAARQVVFTPRLSPPPLPSLFVLPLVVRDRPLGTLVLGSRTRSAFHEGVKSTLEVLASHMAVSLSNARMVRRLEEMATTDPLTGLLNRRALEENAEAKLLAAQRFSRKVSVLVLDIDHFKRVNDTYGHDVGDLVLKGLGGMLRRVKRATDAVARFGGEEFVVVCDETDQAGALLLAERVREELARTTFHSPQGAIAVTCSIGIASFPDGGRDLASLFRAADEALYRSKHEGRNRSTVWRPPRKGAARSVA